MRTFKVLVHGRGLVVRRWWLLRRRLGFYATRFVDAESAELAVEDVEVVEGPASTWPQPGIVFYPARAGMDPVDRVS